MGCLLKNLQAVPARARNRMPAVPRDYCTTPRETGGFFVYRWLGRSRLAGMKKYAVEIALLSIALLLLLVGLIMPRGGGDSDRPSGFQNVFGGDGDHGHETDGDDSGYGSDDMRYGAGDDGDEASTSNEASSSEEAP